MPHSARPGTVKGNASGRHKSAVIKGEYHVIMGRFLSKKGRRILFRRLLPVSLILGACTAGAYVVNSAQYNDHFLPGTTINGIDVSDMTIGEAASDLRAAKAGYAIKLRFRGGSEAVIDGKDVGLVYDCEGELEQLMNEQNRHSWLSRELAGDITDLKLKSSYKVDESELKGAILSLPELADGNYIKPEDASIIFTKDKDFSLVPEVDGTELNSAVLTDLTEEAMSKGRAVLDLTKKKGVYEEPQVRVDDEELLKQQEALNSFLRASVNIVLGEGNVVTVDKKTTRSWVSVDSKGRYTVNRDNVHRQALALMADVAKKDDNLGNFRTFASTNFGMQRFETESMHGHTLNQAKMAETLTDMLMRGVSGDLKPVYSRVIDTLDPRFGGTYLEVDIYSQHVYYYQDYQLVYDCNCVSGTEGYSGTPSGIFSVDEKIRGRQLEGYRQDGTLSYSVHVDYWIRFLPHYGFHDASWRDSFGGSIYEYDGSHGCVNLPYNAAATLYDLVEYDTPVTIFRGAVDA